MARERPAASNVIQPPVLICLDGGRPTVDGPLLSRAEARELRRSAPLTHAKLKEYFKTT